MATSQNKIQYVKVLNCLDVGKHEVLYYIFKCGTPNKPDNVPLNQYLDNLPPDSTANYPKAKQKFTNKELEKITDDPSCKSFDISLLYKVLKLACEEVADWNDSLWHTPSDTLEYYITAIKNHRNDKVHGGWEITNHDFLISAADMRQLFLKTLTATKERYGLQDEELANKTRTVEDALDNIMVEVLGEEDLLAYRCPRLKQDLIKEANQVLDEQLHKSIAIDPISFLTNTKLHLQVHKVFTEIRVTCGKDRRVGKHMKYQDIITVARSGAESTRPQVLLVEGVAGSGKTTFTTLVIGEWLKSGQSRTITGLDHYDMLLRVQCWERGITSFSSLLETRVSSVFLKFRKLFLHIIKKCKVLIIIDGIDEINEDSKKLLNDILTQMSTVNDCTLLCTSRPESVISFTAKLPSEYRVTFVELLGIPELSQTQFIRRYHEEIKNQTGDTQDTEEFVQKVRQVLGQEHFRLPLNLVFLTWIYLKNPEAVTTTTTQTGLYHITSQMCVKKLLERLATRSINHNVSRRELETSLEECLAGLHHESLLAVWNSQLGLERDAENRITKICRDKGVPSEELLSAFLNLKGIRTHGGVLEQEQYFAPHKGLQDYYAARHIADHQTLTTASGNIRGILQSTLNTHKPQLSWFQKIKSPSLGEPIQRLQNVLYHVAGLLPSNVTHKVAKEVVDLLQESGVSSRDEWLDLLANSGTNLSILVQRVAYYFPSNPQEGALEITDSRVRSCKALLPLLPASEIKLSFRSTPVTWEELLESLQHHICTELHLHHHYRDPQPGDTSDLLLQQVTSRNGLKVLRGHLSVRGLAWLPLSLERLSLALTSGEEADHLLSALWNAFPRLPNLRELRIHACVVEGMATHLTPLPDARKGRGGVRLLLSGVGDQQVEEAWLVAKALQPLSGYEGITFPRGTATEGGWRRLVEGLSRVGVRVGMAGLVVPDTTITKQQEENFNRFTRIKLRCGFEGELEDYFNLLPNGS